MKKGENFSVLAFFFIRESNTLTTTQDIATNFHSRLKGFILKKVDNEQDAEDILQEVFYKIHNNIDGLRNYAKLESWLYQIVRNALKDFYHRQKADVEYAEKIPDITEEPDRHETRRLASCLKPMIYTTCPKNIAWL
jgi:RNA polymerase sigma-70 factor (ECF subfamily)